MWGVFGQRAGVTDLIPLVPQPDWELDGLFEARGERPHRLADPELAERCEVDHATPHDGVRFGPGEMCEDQWVCVAAYYTWLDEKERGERWLGRRSAPAGAGERGPTIVSDVDESTVVSTVLVSRERLPMR